MGLYENIKSNLKESGSYESVEAVIMDAVWKALSGVNGPKNIEVLSGTLVGANNPDSKSSIKFEYNGDTYVVNVTKIDDPSTLKESKVTEQQYMCDDCGYAFDEDELTSVDDDGNDLCPACGSSDITDTGSDEDFDESQKLNESSGSSSFDNILDKAVEIEDYNGNTIMGFLVGADGEIKKYHGCDIADEDDDYLFNSGKNLIRIQSSRDSGDMFEEASLKEREVEKSWSDDGKSLNIREMVARIVESDDTHDFGELSEKEIDYLFDALFDGPEFHDGLYELIKRIVIPIAEKMRSKDKLNESAKDDELYQLVCKRLEEDFKKFKKANPGKSDYFFKHNYDGSAIVDEFNNDYGTNFSFTIKFDPWQIPYPSVNKIDDNSIKTIYDEVMSNGRSKSPNGNGLSLRGSYICRSNPYDMADDDCRPYNANNSNMVDFKKWLNEIDSVPSRIDRS